MPTFKDIIREKANAFDAGSFTFTGGGNISGGHLGFAEFGSDQTKVYYTAVDNETTPTKIEVGYGTYTHSTGVVTRNMLSSTTGLAIDFSGGDVYVVNSIPEEWITAIEAIRVSGSVGTASASELLWNNAATVDGVTGSVVDGSGNVTLGGDLTLSNTAAWLYVGGGGGAAGMTIDGTNPVIYWANSGNQAQLQWVTATSKLCAYIGADCIQEWGSTIAEFFVDTCITGPTTNTTTFTVNASTSVLDATAVVDIQRDSSSLFSISGDGAAKILGTLQTGSGNSTAHYPTHFHSVTDGNSWLHITDTGSGQTSTDGAFLGLSASNQFQLWSEYPIAFYPNSTLAMTLDSTLNATIEAGDLIFNEKAAVTSTPIAGKGYLWVKSTAPSTLIFTDDDGTDTTLGAGGGGGTPGGADTQIQYNNSGSFGGSANLTFDGNDVFVNAGTVHVKTDAAVYEAIRLIQTSTTAGGMITCKRDTNDSFGVIGGWDAGTERQVYIGKGYGGSTALSATHIFIDIDPVYAGSVSGTEAERRIHIDNSISLRPNSTETASTDAAFDIRHGQLTADRILEQLHTGQFTITRRSLGGSAWRHLVLAASPTYGGLFCYRNTVTASEFNIVSAWDNGSSIRQLYFGDGAWGVKAPTQITFGTTTYGAAANVFTTRFTIPSNGRCKLGINMTTQYAEFTDAVGGGYFAIEVKDTTANSAPSVKITNDAAAWFLYVDGTAGANDKFGIYYGTKYGLEISTSYDVYIPNGNLTVTAGDVTLSDGSLIVTEATDIAAVPLTVNHIAGATGNIASFGLTGSLDLMTITQQGHVGIGSGAAPDANTALHVRTTASGSRLFFETTNANGAPSLQLKNGTQHWAIYNDGSLAGDLDNAIAFYDYTGSNYALYITTGLDVVIPSGTLNFSSAGGVAIATGTFTRTKSYHRVDTQASAATDDLDTINGGVEGDVLVLRAYDSARTVVAKDGTGNLALNGDFSLDNVEDTLTLIYDGSNWIELSRSDNGA